MSNSERCEGILFIVGTPIGNLSDITFRAVETLKKVDLVAAEDTRRTKILLNRYNISTPCISYHRHNQTRRIPQIISYLRGGKNIALVSDAGMPGVADCGDEIINIALQQNIKIEVIPGPVAFLTALILSGIAGEKFIFLGFLPKKKSDRLSILNRIKNYPETIIFYEGKSRVLQTAEDVLQILGKRKCALAREMTKLYQEIYRQDTTTLINTLKEKKLLGEYTMVVEGCKLPPKENIDILNGLKMLIKQGYTRKEAVNQLCCEHNLKKNEVYGMSLKIVMKGDV